MSIHIDKISPEASLLQAEEHQLSQSHLIRERLSFLNKLQSFAGPTEVSPCLSYWGAQNQTKHSRCVTPQFRGEGSSFWTASNASLIQPRKPLTSFASRAHCCSCWAWCPPVPPRPFLQSCFPASQHWYNQLFLPRSRTSQDSCQSLFSACCLIHTSSVCQGGCYGSLCQKSY